MTRRHAFLTAFVMAVAVLAYVVAGVSWLAVIALLGIAHVVLVASL